MNNTVAHTKLCNEILDACGALPGVVIGVNPCGKARHMTRDGKTFVVPYGWPMPGAPDILAVVAPLGRLVGLEVKTGAGVASPEQRQVHDALRAVGAQVLVVRSVDEARAALLAVGREGWGGGVSHGWPSYS